MCRVVRLCCSTGMSFHVLYGAVRVRRLGRRQFAPFWGSSDSTGGGYPELEPNLPRVSYPELERASAVRVLESHARDAPRRQRRQVPSSMDAPCVSERRSPFRDSKRGHKGAG
jgi:hypothetical protein